MRAVLLLSRALRLRCPHCGSGPIFTGWGRMLPNCAGCGFRLERGERGYWLGAYFLNIMLVETVFVAVLCGVLFATWPTPPWGLLQACTILAMLAAPVLCFPFSKTLFLAFDLLVRPAEEQDFRNPAEPALNPGRRARGR